MAIFGASRRDFAGLSDVASRSVWNEILHCNLNKELTFPSRRAASGYSGRPASRFLELISEDRRPSRGIPSRHSGKLTSLDDIKWTACQKKVFVDRLNRNMPGKFEFHANLGYRVSTLPGTTFGRRGQLITKVRVFRLFGDSNEKTNHEFLAQKGKGLDSAKCKRWEYWCYRQIESAHRHSISF